MQKQFVSQGFPPASRRRGEPPTYDMRRLLTKTGIETVRELAELLDVSLSVARKRMERGIAEYEADGFAVRLGFHPVEVWPEWFQGVPPLDDEGGLVVVGNNAHVQEVAYAA